MPFSYCFEPVGHLIRLIPVKSSKKITKMVRILNFSKLAKFRLFLSSNLYLLRSRL